MLYHVLLNVVLRMLKSELHVYKYYNNYHYHQIQKYNNVVSDLNSKLYGTKYIKSIKTEPTQNITNKFMSSLKGFVTDSAGNLYGPEIQSAAGRSRSGRASTDIDYNRVLATIVSILTAIANNTSTLNKILDVLSNSGIKIDRSSIQAAAANSRNAENDIRDLVNSAMSRSGRRRSNGSSYVPTSTGTDTDSTAYLVQVMEAIARQ